MPNTAQSRALGDVQKHLEVAIKKGKKLLTSVAAPLLKKKKPTLSIASSTFTNDADRLLHTIQHCHWTPPQSLTGKKSSAVAPALNFFKTLVDWVAQFARLIQYQLISKKLPESTLKTLILQHIQTQLKSYIVRGLILGGFLLILFAAWWLWDIWSYLGSHNLKLDSIGKTAFILAITLLSAGMIGIAVATHKVDKVHKQNKHTLWTYKEILRLRAAIRRHSKSGTADISSDEIEAYKVFLSKKIDVISTDPEKLSLSHLLSYIDSWEPERLYDCLDHGSYSSQLFVLWRKWPDIWGFISNSSDLKNTLIDDLSATIRKGIEQSAYDDQDYCNIMLSDYEWHAFLDKAKKAASKLGNPQPKGYEQAVYNFFSTTSQQGLEKIEHLLECLDLKRQDVESNPRRLFQMLSK